MNILENFSTIEMPIFYEFSKGMEKIIQEYHLAQKGRKRNNISKNMWKIIIDLSKEDLFKNVDKIKLYNFLFSKIDVLEPYDITREELYRRIRKIIAIEAMSRIFDGYPEQLILFEKRRDLK